MEPVSKIWNRKFVLLFLTNLLVLAAFYASIPIIPVYCQEIGITGARVGIVLTAMSLATILFRPVAGYLLDNFNRYRVYLLFLALFCLAFPAFLVFPIFGALVIIRLYMGAVYSVCGSATMTLAGDVLPPRQDHRGHQPLCLHHLHRHGGGPLCGHPGPEPPEQQDLLPDGLCHRGGGPGVRLLLPDQVSQGRAEEVRPEGLH